MSIEQTRFSLPADQQHGFDGLPALGVGKSLKELKKAKTPKAWSLESRRIAVEKAYLHGELKGGTSKETAQDLPEGYTKAAKVVAEKQAALAGYRLTDEIQKWVR